MFDWDDEELTNIIWGETGESDDHIVPYPDKIEKKPQVLFGDIPKKEANQQTSNVRFLEHKKSSIKSEAGVELDRSPRYDTRDPDRGFGLNSWPGDPDASFSNAAKVDGDSVSAAASNVLTKSTKNGSLADETAQFDKGSKLFQNPPDDREDSDFDDYEWANIGSFEDLDKIFSNNDPIFGDVNVGNTDELWLSTKDVNRSPLGATPLSCDSSGLRFRTPRTSSDGSETKVQYMLDSGQCFISGSQKLNEGTSHTPYDVQESIDTFEQYGGQNKVVLKEKGLEMSGKIQACSKQLGDVTAATTNELPGKGNRQKKLLKSQTKDKKIEVRQLHDACGTWSSSGSPFLQVNPQYPLPMFNAYPPLVLSQQGQHPRPEILQQKHFSGPLLASPLNGSMVNHYPAPSVLAAPSAYQVLPGNANSLKNSVNPTVKPPAMSPREKIEKLRRRQKMRAMLAIQRQQQQFGKQVSLVEHPTIEARKIEVDETLGSFPSIDPNFSTDRDDSHAINTSFGYCSVEDSVLRRLQDTIANLDTHIRLGIRDSLFRLAHSAMRRQYSSDTSSTSTSSRDVLSNKDNDNHERFTRMPDIETDTNPIDRTVAHLLFHRSLELSGKLETPELPSSGSFPYERTENPLSNLANVPESYKDNQMTSPQGSNTRGLFSGETSEISSSNDNADGNTKMVEASK